MAGYPHIERYHSELQELIQFGGSDSELNIRSAFQNCLADYCRDHQEKLALVPELRALTGVIPDGTVKDTLRMARGYWEAKDSADDLDAEIERKFNRGYPRDNILIWAKMGRELLDLHINFESAEPYPLERLDKAMSRPGSDAEWTPKPRLRADKERGIITLDEQTTLSGVPPDAWRYVLGSRSALE